MDIIDRRFEFQINGIELADFQICDLFGVVSISEAILFELIVIFLPAKYNEIDLPIPHYFYRITLFVVPKSHVQFNQGEK